MSTLNQFLPRDKALNDQKIQQNNLMPLRNTVNGNSMDNKHSDVIVEIPKLRKFENINQYDQPNQFYKLGPYVLDQVIGKGNFSVVKLAVHTPTQMQVAIKILHKSKMSKETLEKTYREVHIMKQLSHPFIVRLYQVIDTVNWLFIVMEYAVNGELFDYLSRIGRFNEQEARIKFGQILDAVDYCHQMNVVHRDLKAENLLLDKNQNIKLADFGFGSFYENSFLLSTWCGSPPYAAPELFKGEPYVGPKADIWSLGVILYAMVCGTLPFDEPTNIVKLREQVLCGWVRFPYFLSYECENLIRLILNRSPMKRPTIATIKHHKWMQPTFESLHKSDKDLWNSSPLIHSSQRCNTLGADSGFDEPVSDFCKPTQAAMPILTNAESKEFDFNEHAIQIMERCGINRSEICEELISKKFGPHTATYLLLSERLRIHRQSYPPLKQDYININCNCMPQTDFNLDSLNQIKFISDSNSIKLGVTDLVENINSDFKRVTITDKKMSPQNNRRSPYENITNNFGDNVLRNNFFFNSPKTDARDSFFHCNLDKQSNEVQDFQEAQHSARRRNTSSVNVDVTIPHEQALQEIFNQNQKTSFHPFHINENLHAIPKYESVKSPEYIISYPREYFTPRKQTNFTPQTCIMLDPCRTLKDPHMSKGAKLNDNHNNQLSDNCNPYSNLYSVHSNAVHPISSLYACDGNYQHHKPASYGAHPQSMSPTRPIMIAAQSIHVPSSINNGSYNEVINDSSQNLKNSASPPFCQRNQCSDSSLQCEHSPYGLKHAYDHFSTGVEAKSENFNFISRPNVEADSNFKNLQMCNNFNPPLLIRPSNFPQCTPQIIPCQPQTINYERFSNNYQQYVPFPSEIPSFNVIPIPKFVPADLNYVKFS